MSPFHRRWTAAMTVMFFVSLTPAGAQDQTTSPGWSLYPSVKIGAVYDDNLFFRRDVASRSTVYTRFGAALDAIHQGRTSSFRGGYAMEGEVFSGSQEDLTEIPSSQRGSFTVSSQIGSKSTFTAGASYQVSRDPSQVFDLVGIELGRRRAEGYSADVGYERRLSANNSVGARYAFGWRELDFRASFADVNLRSTSHSIGTNWDHMFSRLTTGSLRYSYRLYIDDSLAPLLGLQQSMQSHVTGYGWSHQLTQRTSVNIYGGPNVYQDFELGPDGELLPETRWRVTPDVSASIEREGEKNNMALAYGRSQNQFVGAAGSVITDSLTFTLGLQPSRIFSITFSPGARRNTQGGQSYETYIGRVDAQLEITRWWSLVANYGYTYQERFFGIAGEEIDLDGRQSRNRAYVGIVIGKTVPLE